MNQAFLKGFAETTSLSLEEADTQWAAFSRMLTDEKIRKIERRGFAAGVQHGKEFRKCYPADTVRCTCCRVECSSWNVVYEEGRVCCPSCLSPVEGLNG